MPKKHLLVRLQRTEEEEEPEWTDFTTQTMLPSARIPPLESSASRSPHPLLRVPYPISKSIKCVCEAEEAHQLTAAPPPFFSSVASFALQLPLPCSPAAQPAPHWMLLWEAGREVAVVLAHIHQISICADTTKETGGRGRKKPQLGSCPCLCCLPPPFQMNSWADAALARSPSLHRART